MKHKKITKTERELLSQWKKEGLSNIQCAKHLGRHVSTIGRELTRNKTRLTVGRNDWEVIYEPLHAQQLAEDRRQKAFNAKHPLKNSDIYSYVQEDCGNKIIKEILTGKYVWRQSTNSYTKKKLTKQSKDSGKIESLIKGCRMQNPV